MMTGGNRSPAKSIFQRALTRKAFLKLCLSIIAFTPFHGYFAKEGGAKTVSSNGRPKSSPRTRYDLVIARGEDPFLMTVRAIESLGGMDLFVKKGGVVVVKPNIGWDRAPEQAANTNPEVVAALVELSFKAGAKSVKVFDSTCNDARRCYANSGIEKAARAKGADVYYPDDWDMVGAHFNHKSLLEGWPILKDAVRCDTFINVPVLKHHGLTGLTLSMKNLMGVCGGDRGIMHRDIGEKLVDLTQFINPDLTVIDAYRVLLRNGPTGGDLKDVALKKTIAVSADPTLADAFACSLVGTDPMSVSYIRNAAERKFGIADIESSRSITIEV